MKKIGLCFLTFGILSISATNDSIRDREILQYSEENIVVATLENLSASHTIESTPDTATLTVTHEAKGKDEKEAQNTSEKTVNEFIDYLKSLGVNSKDLTTISYNTYKRNESVSVKTDKEPLIEYEIYSKAQIDIGNVNFFDVVNALDKYDIDDLEKVQNTNYYVFSLISKNVNEKEAKNSAKILYDNVTKDMKNMGINDIQVIKYDVNTNEMDNDKKEEIHYVSHTLNIKLTNIDNVNKVYTKARDLKMTVGTNVDYSLSEEKKEELLLTAYEKATDKLYEKAKILANKQSYNLGDPNRLTLNNSPIFYEQPRNISYSNDNYIEKRIVTEAIQIEPEIITSVQTNDIYKITGTVTGSFDIIKRVQVR